MNYRKTYYNFNVADMNYANNIMQNFIQSNHYAFMGQIPVILDGMNVQVNGFKHQTAVCAIFVEYAILNNKIHLFVYGNSPQKPLPIDDNSMVGGLTKAAVEREIRPLIEQFTNINQIQYNQHFNNQPTQYNQQPQNNQSQYNTQISNAQYKQNTTLSNNTNTIALIALLGAIGSLLVSFAGGGIGILTSITFGIMAVMGIKDKNTRTKSIIALVLLVIALLISIVFLITKK